MGSYNALVASEFQLAYEADVMAVVVLNTPSFLETTFKHWLQSQKGEHEALNELIAKFGANPLQAYFIRKFGQVIKVAFRVSLLWLLSSFRNRSLP